MNASSAVTMSYSEFSFFKMLVFFSLLIESKLHGLEVFSELWQLNLRRRIRSSIALYSGAACLFLSSSLFRKFLPLFALFLAAFLQFFKPSSIATTTVLVKTAARGLSIGSTQ